MKKRNIILPRFIQSGIKHRSGTFPERVRWFAGDVETCNGLPITIQLADNAETGDLLWVKKETILPKFIDWIKPRLLSKQVNVCFFHNLSFDLTALLYNYLHLFTKNQFEMEFEDIKLEVLCAKIYYAKFKFPCGTVLHLIDTFRFFTTSLANAGKALKCKNVKGPKPDGLGTTKYTKKDREFIDYALADSLLGYEIGSAVIEMHRKYNVPLSISAPQFAARVFTRFYMQPGDLIDIPPRLVMGAALDCYHGGKNGFYVKPGLYANVTELDISSAYPNAMAGLPQFVDGNYVSVLEYREGFHGIYRISGKLKHCRYSPFMNHNGQQIFGPCEIKDLWVTCYELKEAMDFNEIEITRIDGYIWVPNGEGETNALSDYVAEFYALKESTPKGDANYLTYKLLLNSLYGKFIQNLEENSEILAEWIMLEDGTKTRVKKTFKAGGLFNPFIASLITGHVRAYLHRLEHKYEAIHSSTDSVKTMLPIKKEDLPTGLGGLGIEVTGDCYILRNKLYLHYNGLANDETPKKYALHGFQGNAKTLYNLIQEKGSKYEIDRLMKPKEAHIQNKVALKSYHLERTVKIDWKNYQERVDTMAKGKAKGKNKTKRVDESYWL